jgi:hypothetical protein
MSIANIIDTRDDRSPRIRDIFISDIAVIIFHDVITAGQQSETQARDKTRVKQLFDIIRRHN